MLPRRTLSLVAGLALAGSSLALSGGESTAAPGNDGSSLDLEKFNAALDSIVIPDLKADLTWIASDERGGRDTPSIGLEETAQFIKKRLEGLGIEAGAKNGYFHEYPLRYLMADLKETRLTLKKGTAEEVLEFPKDYYFSADQVVNDTFKGELVFCGRGTKGDFKGLRLSGKWAVCIHDLRERPAKNAAKSKAKGVLIIPDPKLPADAYDRGFALESEAARRSQVSWPRKNREKHDRQRISMPEVRLSHSATLRMLALAGVEDPESWSPEKGESIGLNVLDERKIAGKHGNVMLKNVCGFWPGNHSRLKKQVIILSAHYDHKGVLRGQVMNGADDNGSGTTGLLAIAKALTVYGPLSRSVLLIWVSGEEEGLYGSQAWAQNPELPRSHRPFANINIDMIGRNDPNRLNITPTRKHKHYNGLTRLAEEFAPEEKFTSLGSADAYWSRSDHINFATLGIPVAFLFAGTHRDYHQPTDDVDKIDFDKLRRASRLALRMIGGLQNPKVKLKLK